MTTISSAQLTIQATDLPEHTAQVARYTQLGLPRFIAEELEERAARITSISRRTVYELGQELLAAREQAKHGTWLPFLERCGIEERTARNYISVAERFANKPEIISALPPTALYALAAPSADPGVVAAIMEEVEQGARPSAAEVRARLAPERPADADPTPPAAPPTPLHPLMESLLVPASPTTARPPALNLTTAEPEPARPAQPERLLVEVEDRPTPAPTAPPAAPAARPPAAAPPAPTAPAPAEPAPAALPAAPRPVPAAPPPAPAPPPLVLTPIPPVSDAEADRHERVARYWLAQAVLDDVRADLEAGDLDAVIIGERARADAARLFGSSPAFTAAARLLALSAQPATPVIDVEHSDET